MIVTLLIASFASVPVAFAQPAENAPPAGWTEPPPALPPAAVAPAAAPEPAPAIADLPPKPAEQPKPQGPPRYDLVRINVGGRVGYIRDGAYDVFSENDVLGQFSIDGTVPLYHRGKLVLGAGLGWDYGGQSSTFRGFASSMKAHRFSVPLEARWNFVPGIWGFGKVSPGAVLVSAHVEDPTASLSATSAAFSVDASAGAAILIGPRTRFDERKGPRFWVTPEVGYAFTTDASLAMSTGRESKDMLGNDEEAKLRSLSLSGLFWRLSMAVTF
jgi:hypothetical protein